MIIPLGAFGQTILTLKKTDHISGDRLILRQRSGAMELGEADILAVAAFAEACKLVPHPKAVAAFRRKIHDDLQEV